jgi:hypothetical protein
MNGRKMRFIYSFIHLFTTNPCKIYPGTLETSYLELTSSELQNLDITRL